MVRRNGEKRGVLMMRMGGGKFISLSSTFVELHFLLLNDPLFVGLNNEFRMMFPVQGEHRRYPRSEKRGKWEPFWLEITWELNHWRLSKQNLFRGKNLFHNNKNNNNQLVLFIILSFVLLVAIVPRQDCFSEKVSKGHELSAPAAGNQKQAHRPKLRKLYDSCVGAGCNKQGFE